VLTFSNDVVIVINKMEMTSHNKVSKISGIEYEIILQKSLLLMFPV